MASYVHSSTDAFGYFISFGPFNIVLLPSGESVKTGQEPRLCPEVKIMQLI